MAIKTKNYMEPCTQAERILTIEIKQGKDHKTINEIRDALLGTEFNPDDGAIKKIERNDNKVADLKDAVYEVKQTIDKFKTWIAAAATVFGIVFTALQFIINYFQKHGN